MRDKTRESYGQTCFLSELIPPPPHGGARFGEEEQKVSFCLVHQFTILQSEDSTKNILFSIACLNEISSFDLDFDLP